MAKYDPIETMKDAIEKSLRVAAENAFEKEMEKFRSKFRKTMLEELNKTILECAEWFLIEYEEGDIKITIKKEMME
jgi:hypothetical protein